MNHTIGVTGKNDDGQLGCSGTPIRQLELVRLSDAIPTSSPIVQIDCGYTNTAILTADGKVYLAGRGLVDDTSNTKFQPVPGLENKFVKKVIAGPSRAFFLLDNGSLMAVGSNSYSQLGFPNNVETTTALKVPAFTIPRGDEPALVTDGTCSYSFSTFVVDRRHIFVCGQNWLLPSRSSSPSAYLDFPELQEDEYIEQISGGSFHVFLLTSKGFVYSGGETGSKLAQISRNSYSGFKKVTLFSERAKIAKCRCDQSVIVTESNKVYLFGLGLRHAGMFWSETNELYSLKLPESTLLRPIVDISLGRYATHVVYQNEIFSLGNNEHATLNIGSEAINKLNYNNHDVAVPMSSSGCILQPHSSQRYAVASGEYHTIVYLLPYDLASINWFHSRLLTMSNQFKFSDVDILPFTL